MLKILNNIFRKLFIHKFKQSAYGELVFDDETVIINYRYSQIVFSWKEIEKIEAVGKDGVIKIWEILIFDTEKQSNIIIDSDMGNWDSFFDFLVKKLPDFDESKCNKTWIGLDSPSEICWQKKTGLEVQEIPNQKN